MTERELGISLFIEAVELFYDLEATDEHRNRDVPRLSARLIERTLRRAEAAHLAYGLTRDHRDALLAIMRLIQLPRDFIDRSDHTSIAVGPWQLVLIEALRCCIYGTGEQASVQNSLEGGA